MQMPPFDYARASVWFGVIDKKSLPNHRICQISRDLQQSHVIKMRLRDRFVAFLVAIVALCPHVEPLRIPKGSKQPLKHEGMITQTDPSFNEITLQRDEPTKPPTVDELRFIALGDGLKKVEAFWTYLMETALILEIRSYFQI
ncbi:hypothetical protein CCR75_005040 [Bremia lactucae]|uniref:Uncharacterized protein n=1 Tax=Bremia lactucae TaxID=4779 RepID=A0A976IEM8_BRELC|nr:hypothetical protein CCR75_005040 [Bremia lactucae]